MNKTERKHQAQDNLVQGMVNAILAESEGAYGEPDEAMLEEMQAQARRVLKLFGISYQPGIGIEE